MSNQIKRFNGDFDILDYDFNSEIFEIVNINRKYHESPDGTWWYDDDPPYGGYKFGNKLIPEEELTEEQKLIVEERILLDI